MLTQRISNIFKFNRAFGLQIYSCFSDEAIEGASGSYEIY